MDASLPESTNQRYENRRGEVQLHMSHFFVRYLNDIYKTFDGDLAMAIVLGEISHHNTAPFFSPGRPNNEPVRAFQEDPRTWVAMAGCNAYSISCSTGIPRETVRRKISTMLKRGWLQDVPNQGLRITEVCANHFGPDFSMRILSAMLQTSRTIEALLADTDNDQAAGPNEPPSRPKPARAAAKSTDRATSKPSRTKRTNEL
jgi:hypothetical protein